MSYQVLARKLRPTGFSSLVGQDHVVRALTHGLDAGRLHHAYLFTGTRGVGKTTIARILAACLNCETGVSSTPCGDCSACREIQEGRFVDLLEVDAASRTRVDDTRELLENAQYLPARGRYKVYLIDEVHMLSTASFNALLKTLEEPPDHIKFLLATTEPRSLPVTVLSRCLQFQLKSIAAAQISGYLAQVMQDEEVPFEEEALNLIAKAARGSMRDALSLTDQAIAFGAGSLQAADLSDLLGVVGAGEVAAMLQAIEAGNPAGVLEVSNALGERAVDFAAALADMIQALHDLAVSHALGEAGSGPGCELTPEALQLHYQIALMGYRDMRTGPDPKTVFEMTLLRMLAFAPDADSAQRVPPAGAQAKSQETPAKPSAAKAQAGGAAETDAQAKPPSAGPLPADGQDSAASDGNLPPDSAGVAGAAREQATAWADEWAEICPKLALSGFDMALAEHCVLVAKAEDAWRLGIEPRYEGMMAEEGERAIETALAQFLKRPLRVQLAVLAHGQDSPHGRREQANEARLAAARQAAEQDSTVQALLELFDGKLIDVKPIRDA